jgi:predicted pyridoxine 5'-phosphate oxidase superfamily flavin-nucleotide-binding protein
MKKKTAVDSKEAGVKKTLGREELEHLTEEFLKEESMCVIATCAHDIPRASSVEFFPLGTTLYILTEGGKKVENIGHNPMVSVAVHAPFTGWGRVRGLQMTGEAEIGRKGSRIFDEGSEAFRKRRGVKTATLPDFMNVIRVRPDKIEYIDSTLEDKGFSMRQVLEL